MKEKKDDSSNWFSKWEKDLPSPEELMPLSQSLITLDLALAFDITNALSSNHPPLHRDLQRPSDLSNRLPPSAVGLHQATSADFGTADSGGGGGDEPARTLKRPRLVWTPQLHKQFVDAVAHLGIKNAVPKTIMHLMNVDGLTRENVASHLQKYRLYLKRMHGLSGAGGGGGGSAAASSDPATDHLFASSPVPPHILHPAGRSNSEHYLPFVPVASLQHHQQMAAAAHPQIQMPYHRPVAQFGPPPNGQFEHPFLSRTGNPVHRVGTAIHAPVQPYALDLDSANGGRKALTLFPTGDD